jgi:hypothetical protein
MCGAEQSVPHILSGDLMASVRLQRVLDKFVSTPALVRRLSKSGMLRIIDAEGQAVEVKYEKTQAGYIDFSNVDETLRMKIPDRYVKPEDLL